MGATAFQRMRRINELKSVVKDEAEVEILLDNGVDQVAKLAELDVESLDLSGDMSKSEAKAVRKSIAKKAKSINGSAAPAEEPEGDSEADEALVSLLDDMTNGEVADHVAEMEDVEELQALLAAEKAGGDRKGAKSAINDRIEELNSEEG